MQVMPWIRSIVGYIGMERLYQPPLPDLASAISLVADLPEFLSRSLAESICGAERACFDRYLRILNALELRCAFDSSLLDIGCSSGFFAYLFAINLCREVTAVEDARGSSAGYTEGAFLGPLKNARREYGLDHLEIVEAPIEEFLTSFPDRKWDVVLCLSVLHHFYTGYGDRPEIGQLSEPQRRRLFEAIGAATGSVLYLEFDHGRMPESFLNQFIELGGFNGCNVIGSSVSAVGETRNLYELWK